MLIAVRSRAQVLLFGRVQVLDAADDDGDRDVELVSDGGQVVRVRSESGSEAVDVDEAAGGFAVGAGLLPAGLPRPVGAEVCDLGVAVVDVTGG